MVMLKQAFGPFNIFRRTVIKEIFNMSKEQKKKHTADLPLNVEGKKGNMFVVTKTGHRLPVDDSTIDYENEYVPFCEPVGLYTNNTILKPVWYVELNTLAYHHGLGDSERKDSPLEFVAEVEFDHEPTENEILWCMQRYKLSRYDIAFIRKGYMLGMEGD